MERHDAVPAGSVAGLEYTNRERVDQLPFEASTQTIAA
jgi:hypothetical protein